MAIIAELGVHNARLLSGTDEVLRDKPERRTRNNPGRHQSQHQL